MLCDMKCYNRTVLSRIKAQLQAVYGISLVLRTK